MTNDILRHALHGRGASHAHTQNPSCARARSPDVGRPPKAHPRQADRHRGTLRRAFAGATPKSQTRKNSGRRKSQRVGEGAWRLHQLLSQSAHSAEEGEALPGPQPKACGGTGCWQCARGRPGLTYFYTRLWVTEQILPKIQSTGWRFPLTMRQLKFVTVAQQTSGAEGSLKALPVGGGRFAAGISWREGKGRRHRQLKSLLRGRCDALGADLPSA